MNERCIPNTIPKHVMFVNTSLFIYLFMIIFAIQCEVGGARLSPFLKGPQSSSITFQMGYCLATKCLNSTNTKCNGIGDRNKQ